MLNRGRLIVALLFFALFSVTLTYNSPVPKPSDLQRIISSLEDKSLILALNPHFQLLLRSLEDYYFKICEELDKGDLVSAEYYYSRFTAAWRAALLEEKLFASKFALFLIICMLIFNLALLFFSMTYARNLKPRIMEHTVLNLVFTGVIAWIYPEGALKAIIGFTLITVVFCTLYWLFRREFERARTAVFLKYLVEFFKKTRFRNSVLTVANSLIILSVILLSSLYPSLALTGEVSSLKVSEGSSIAIITHGAWFSLENYAYNELEEEWLSGRFRNTGRLAPLYTLLRSEVKYQLFVAPGWSFFRKSGNRFLFGAFGEEVFIVPGKTEGLVGALISKDVVEQYGVRIGEVLVIRDKWGAWRCELRILGLLDEAYEKLMNRAFGYKPFVLIVGAVPLPKVQVGYVLNVYSGKESMTLSQLKAICEEGYDAHLLVGCSLYSFSWRLSLEFRGVESFLLLVFAALLTSVSTLSGFYLKKRDYELLLVLGLSPRDLLVLILLEVVIIYIFSISISLILLLVIMLGVPAGFIEGPRLGLNLDSVMLFVLSPLAFMVSPVLVLSKEFLKAVVASKVRRVTFRDVKLDRWNELPIYFPRRAFNRVVDFIVKSLSRYDPYSRIRFSVERFSRSEDRAFILLHFIDLTIEASILVNLRVLCRDEKCIILFKPVSPIGRWGIAERSTLTVFLRAFRKSLLQLQWQLKRESRAS